MVKPRDPEYRTPAAKTFAQELRARFEAAVSASRTIATSDGKKEASAPPARVATPDLFTATDGATPDEPEDVFETYAQGAIRQVAQNQALLDKIRNEGQPWMAVQDALMKALPDVIEDRRQEAYRLVTRFLNEVFGKGKWKTERRQKKHSDGTTAWILVDK
jgi:hypothetical protein